MISSRVIRGGSWYDLARFCRSAYRDWIQPGNRFGVLGFRVIKHQQTKEAKV